jgi:hypothetical protein
MKQEKGIHMENEKQHYPLAKVKALRAYFDATRRSAKGRPEYSDLETTVKLCEQLIALMEKHRPEVSA